MAEYVGTGPYWLDTIAGVGTNGKLNQTQPAAGAEGACDFSTTTTVRSIILSSSGTATSTTTTPAAIDGGWNILTADSDASTNLPAGRLIEAGTVAVTGVVSASQTDVGGTFFIRAIISVRTAAGAFTQLGSADSANINAIAGNAAFSCSVTIARTIIPVGSSLDINLFVNGRGVAITGQIFTLQRGNTTIVATTTGTNFTLPGQGLRYNYTRTQALIGVGTAVKQAITISLNKVVTAVGAISKQVLVSTRKAITGIGLATVRKTLSPLPKSVTGVGSFLTTKVISPLPKVAIGSGTDTVIKKDMLLPKVAIGTGVVTANRTISAARAFLITAVGTPVYNRSVIAARAFLVTAVGAPKVFLTLAQSIINRLTGGGTTVIVKKQTIIFDD